MGTHADALIAKWGKHFPTDDLLVLAEAGYGKQIGLGKRPALLVVDATYSFCGHEPLPIFEAIHKNRRSCGALAWAAMPKMQQLLAGARAAGIPVLFSAMRDPADPAYEPGLWGAKNVRGVEDDGGKTGRGRDNEIVDELKPLPGEIVIAKDKASFFHGTGLIASLVAKNVDSLIICGGTTSGCVYATALDGFSHNYKTVIAADASFDRVQMPHWAALVDFDMKYGDATPTSEILAQLGKK